MNKDWERPGCHYSGASDPSFNFAEDQLERWKEAQKKGAEYSMKYGRACSPLDGCSENLPVNLIGDIPRGNHFAESSEVYQPDTPLGG